MMEGTTGLVIDIGTGTTKSGYAGEDLPKSLFPTILGKPKMPGIIVGGDTKEVYVGYEAIEKRSVLNLNSPVREGIITDWEAIEDILFHIMSNELKISSD